MRLQSYKDLQVWQRAIELVEAIYLATGELPTEETYGLKSQLRRAAISVPSNIAEGYKRKTRKDFVQFLRIANGSAAEIETQLIIMRKLYRSVIVEHPEHLLSEVQKMLAVMIRKLENH